MDTRELCSCFPELDAGVDAELGEKKQNPETIYLPFPSHSSIGVLCFELLVRVII